MAGFNEINMKTILYIASNITNSGGVSRVLSLKTNYLVDKMNYSVHILSTNDETSTPFFDFSSKIIFHYCPVRVSNISAFWNYKKYIQATVNQINTDMIIVADNGIKSFFIKKWLPENICIYELHAEPSYFINGSYNGIKKYLNRFLIKSYLHLFDKIVLLDQSFSLDFIANEKRIVLPNPLTFDTETKSSLNNKKAIAVGRIVPLKGYERMLQAWKKVVTKYPEYVLEIYGENTTEYSLQELINRLDLEKHVQLIAPTLQIKKKYLQADFLLHASYSESFSMVFLEAMHCGLPIIGFDLENNNLATSQNVLFSVNETSYVKNVFEVIENKALANEMAKKGIKISEEYELSKIMNDWNDLFQKTIKQN